VSAGFLPLLPDIHRLFERDFNDTSHMVVLVKCSTEIYIFPLGLF
jgi:hypothetical protein